MKTFFEKINITRIVNLFMLAILLPACKPEAPPAPYKYETNPNFTWGFAEFYGNYYSNYGIQNNVVTLNLFTDNLGINENGELVGTGQYMIIEDVFIAPGDTLLPVGNYKVNNSSEPFTLFTGENYEDNRKKIPSGAYIYYIEPDPSKSKTSLITSGSLNVNTTDFEVYRLDAAFVLDGKTDLKGTFNNKLVHFYQYASTPSGAPRKEIRLAVPFN